MPMNEEPKWYILHTYSGYEAMVKDSLEKLIENNNLGDYIVDLKIPMEQVVEEKNGKLKVVERKLLPCYVFIKMIYTNQIWYYVTSTRGVTGFVGPESKPIPLTQEELDRMLNSAPNSVDSKFAVGEEVRILSGPLENFTGVIEEIDGIRQKLRVKVKMFLGREMQIEVDLDQVEKEK
jgi:transcriptional antiterminator NusG